MFSVEIQLDHLLHKIDALRAEILTPERMLTSLGMSLERVNRTRHFSGLDPDGRPWAPLSHLTIGGIIWKKQSAQARAKKVMDLSVADKTQSRRQRILNDRGHMLQSFHSTVAGGELKLAFDGAWDAQKARWHHFGTGTHGPKGQAYTIKPKSKKALAFGGMVVKEVTHPGIPSRRLIGFPAADAELTRDLVKDHLLVVLNRN